VTSVTNAPRPASPAPGAPLLSVERLVTSVRLGDRDVPAVNDVSFELAAGRTLGLVGESGCGKSLTAMSLLRLLPEPKVRVTGGRILFEGQDLATLPEPALRALRGNRVAVVFQEPATALNPVRTVGDQVGEPLRVHRGLSREAARRRAVELLAAVGIPSPAERAAAYPHQLSGGMKQRVVIAMALACDPALLIADEPTTALDVTVQAQILELLGRLRRERGMALLLITHDLGVVAETCDEVAIMYAGRVVERGAVADVFARPRHPYTRGLLGVLHELEARGGAVARRALHEIPGTVPPVGQVPVGCAFADRCGRAAPRCRVEVPELRAELATEARHASRCFFPVLEEGATEIRP
jgi:peptide/nickel transport system ATP-binding protein